MMGEQTSEVSKGSNPLEAIEHGIKTPPHGQTGRSAKAYDLICVPAANGMPRDYYPLKHRMRSSFDSVHIGRFFDFNTHTLRREPTELYSTAVSPISNAIKNDTIIIGNCAGVPIALAAAAEPRFRAKGVVIIDNFGHQKIVAAAPSTADFGWGVCVVRIFEFEITLGEKYGLYDFANKIRALLDTYKPTLEGQVREDHCIQLIKDVCRIAIEDGAYNDRLFRMEENALFKYKMNFWRNTFAIETLQATLQLTHIPTLLVRCQSTLEEFNNPSFGWSDYCLDLDLAIIDVIHASVLMEDEVDATLAPIRDWLSRRFGINVAAKELLSA